MGHLVNPIASRLGLSIFWNSNSVSLNTTHQVNFALEDIFFHNLFVWFYNFLAKSNFLFTHVIINRLFNKILFCTIIYNASFDNMFYSSYEKLYIDIISSTKLRKNLSIKHEYKGEKVRYFVYYYSKLLDKFEGKKTSKVSNFAKQKKKIKLQTFNTFNRRDRLFFKKYKAFKVLRFYSKYLFGFFKKTSRVFGSLKQFLIFKRNKLLKIKNLLRPSKYFFKSSANKFVPFLPSLKKNHFFKRALEKKKYKVISFRSIKKNFGFHRLNAALWPSKFFRLLYYKNLYKESIFVKKFFVTRIVEVKPGIYRRVKMLKFQKKWDDPVSLHKASIKLSKYLEEKKEQDQQFKNKNLKNKNLKNKNLKVKNLKISSSSFRWVKKDSAFLDSPAYPVFNQIFTIFKHCFYIKIRRSIRFKVAMRSFYGFLKNVHFWYLFNFKQSLFGFFFNNSMRINSKFNFIFFFITSGAFNASLICKYITTRLHQGALLFDIIRPLILKIMTFERTSGFKISCAGRFSRKQIAAYSWHLRGELALNSFGRLIDYYHSSAFLNNSVCGLKVWLCFPEKSFLIKKKGFFFSGRGFSL